MGLLLLGEDRVYQEDIIDARKEIFKKPLGDDSPRA